jgi:hypothetical protein
VQRFAYQVSMGRVNHPKYLTHAEASEFCKLVNVVMPAPTK